MSSMSRVKQYTFFIAGAVFMMCSTLSTYGIAVVTPKLLRQFDAMQHYTLTSLMASIGMLLFLPIVGKLIDSVGRRPILVIGGVISLVSSVAAGLATNFVFFLVMRALITVGLACLTPMPSATLPFLFERKELPKLYGIQGSFLALGTFFGSTVAGFLGDNGLAWVASAYPGVVIFLAATVMFILCPDVPRKPMPTIDFGGMILMACMVAPIMYVASFGPRMGWGNPYIVGGIILAVVAVICFINLEKRVKSPLVDLNLFKNRTYTGALLCTFLMVWYQSSMRNYAPLVIQDVMGMSAAASGSALLPRSITNVIFPVFCGAWVSKKMKERSWKALFITGLLIAGGNIMISFNTTNTTLMVFFVGFGITGIAEAFKQSALTPTVQSTLTAQNMGSGMSLNTMMGSMGSAISSCVFGAIYSSIVPDPNIIPDLIRGTNAVFLTAGVSGLFVSLIAFFLIRTRKTVEAKTSNEASA